MFRQTRSLVTENLFDRTTSRSDDALARPSRSTTVARVAYQAGAASDFIVPLVGDGDPFASRGGAAQTLTWDPNSTGSASGSDNSGNWDTTTADWFNGDTQADTGWFNGADAIIGAGSTLTTGGFAPVLTIDEPIGVVVNSITFNAVGAGSTTGYTIADSSGTAQTRCSWAAQTR